MSTKVSQIFIMQNYATSVQEYVIVTPDLLPQEIVMAAWSYAVRYTAKGIDLPDHAAAANLLKQRHPSWNVIQTTAMTVGVNLALADKDQPEG